MYNYVYQSDNCWRTSVHQSCEVIQRFSEDLAAFRISLDAAVQEVLEKSDAIVETGFLAHKERFAAVARILADKTALESRIHDKAMTIVGQFSIAYRTGQITEASTSAMAMEYEQASVSVQTASSDLNVLRDEALWVQVRGLARDIIKWCEDPDPAEISQVSQLITDMTACVDRTCEVNQKAFKKVVELALSPVLGVYKKLIASLVGSSLEGAGAKVLAQAAAILEQDPAAEDFDITSAVSVFNSLGRLNCEYNDITGLDAYLSVNGVYGGDERDEILKPVHTLLGPLRDSSSQMGDLIAQHLQTYYEVLEVGGGGDCLFRSIARGMGGKPSDHTKVRKAIVRYMGNNMDSMEPYIRLWMSDERMQRLGFTTPESYVKHMSKLGSFGNRAEIVAAAEAFQRPFVTVHSSFKECLGERKKLQVNETHISHECKGDTRPIFLHHTGAEHYQVLIRKPASKVDSKT